MKLTEICLIVAGSTSSSLIFFAFGMKFPGALVIGALFCLVGFSVLNYLNHGKFHPFVRLSPAL